MGSQKYEHVGKSQSVLIVANPIIFTLPRMEAPWLVNGGHGASLRRHNHRYLLAQDLAQLLWPNLALELLSQLEHLLVGAARRGAIVLVVQCKLQALGAWRSTLLTRRARNASGTATQRTRINDSPPPPPPPPLAPPGPPPARPHPAHRSTCATPSLSPPTLKSVWKSQSQSGCQPGYS
jgi:hypothetical protein